MMQISQVEGVGDTDSSADHHWGTEQSRMVTWHDPLATQAIVASMAGLSYWRAVVDGQLPPPPIGDLLQMEIKVNYLKPVELASGELTAVGTVVKAGSRVGFTEGAVTDGSGALVATATSTLLIIKMRGPARHSGNDQVSARAAPQHRNGKAPSPVK